MSMMAYLTSQPLPHRPPSRYPPRSLSPFRRPVRRVRSLTLDIFCPHCLAQSSI